MNAIVAVRSADRVHLYTDGASCDADGVLESLQARVQLFPHWSAAVATRGAREVPAMLRLYWPDCALTFDDAVMMLANVARGIHAVLEHEQRPFPHFEIVLAGWSEESEAFEVFDLWGGPPSPDGPAHPAFTLRRQTEIIRAWPGLECAERGGSPEAIGHSLMTAARAEKVAHREPPHRLHHAVGGFIQETVLSPGACSTRILARWDDRMGSRISPTQAGAESTRTLQ